jgi:hypothetical protein
MAARNQMKDRSSLSAYAAVLLALTLLFFVRVLAQALVAFFEIPFLPSFLFTLGHYHTRGNATPTRS